MRVLALPGTPCNPGWPQCRRPGLLPTGKPDQSRETSDGTRQVLGRRRGRGQTIVGGDARNRGSLADLEKTTAHEPIGGERVLDKTKPADSPIRARWLERKELATDG